MAVLIKSSLLRLFFTLRHLRAEQIIYRIYFRFGRQIVRHRALRSIGNTSRRRWSAPWSAPMVSASSHLSPGVFFFLGEQGEVCSVADWNSTTKTKLWLYNLHYFDDLNAKGADERAQLHEWLIARWIQDNPPIKGNGWEPYPLALRIVNLVKLFARRENVPQEWIASLARQAQALYAQEERHLLANHLFVDGKALVFVGAFLGGEAGQRWLERGLCILDEEMSEQFLTDGGNFELSPMYHASLLWDVCDLIRLSQIAGLTDLTQRVAGWMQVVTRGLDWLQAICHPDGGVSFFNDAAFGIAPTLAELIGYAELIDCPLPPPSEQTMAVRHLAETGYAVLDWVDGSRAILDVAEVGPAYQPGHAHADTLSYEWSVFGQRVVVNSGTSQYGEDAERQRQRGTSAHNTVTVNGEDSSEVWAGFRVARRARPFDLQISRDRTRIRVSCSHDGYRRLPGSPIHRRTWEAGVGFFRVCDRIEGRFSSAISRVYLHPDVQMTKDGSLLLPGGQCLRFTVTGGAWSILPSVWHPGFGQSVFNNCIEICLSDAESVIEFNWD